MKSDYRSLVTKVNISGHVRRCTETPQQLFYLSLKALKKAHKFSVFFTIYTLSLITLLSLIPYFCHHLSLIPYILWHLCLIPFWHRTLLHKLNFCQYNKILQVNLHKIVILYCRVFQTWHVHFFHEPFCKEYLNKVVH